MPITYVKGDLLKAKLDVIGHQCNCYKTMGGGIALQIKKTFPQAYFADLNDKRSPEERYGSFTKATRDDKELTFVYNLYGQLRYGHEKRHTNYNKLYDALRLMKFDLMEAGIYDVVSIGFPRLGCALGGGLWTVVEQILLKVFHDKEIFVYTLE